MQIVNPQLYSEYLKQKNGKVETTALDDKVILDQNGTVKGILTEAEFKKIADIADPRVMHIHKEKKSQEQRPNPSMLKYGRPPDAPPLVQGDNPNFNPIEVIN